MPALQPPMSSSPLPASGEIRAVDDVLGAEVIGVDLAVPLESASLVKFKAALDQYKVLVFRDQELTKKQLVGISRQWGSLGEHIMAGATREDFKEINVMSNVGPDGKPTGKHTDESAKRWHTDRSWMPKPAFAMLLYGVEVPSSGGDTLFANATMAYDALPDDVRHRIDNLDAIHSIEYSRLAGGGRPATEEEKRRAPPVRHPLARVHPGTGKKSVYCGCHAWKVEGLPESEGRELLDYLINFAVQDRFVYRHRWKKNDLVIWDNRCTFHAATDFDTANEIRVMYRTIVE